MAGKPLVEREVTVTRLFDAPRPLVFSMWTDAKHVAAWWGPHTFDNPKVEVDPRPGGKILIHMRRPDGGVHPMGGVYDEVTPHSRIVWTNEEGGENGSVTTVTFEEKDGQTLLVMSELYPSKEAFDAAGTGAAEATHETFGQLDDLLAELEG